MGHNHHHRHHHHNNSSSNSNNNNKNKNHNPLPSILLSDLFMILFPHVGPWPAVVRKPLNPAMPPYGGGSLQLA